MIKIDSIKCPQDHPCPLIKMCPVDAISQEGVGLPKIDNDKCIKCLVCVANCPLNAVEDSKK